MPETTRERQAQEPSVSDLFLFRDSFFVPEKNWLRKAILLPLIVLLHAALIVALVSIPLLSVDKGPKVEIIRAFLAPPPPPPPAQRAAPESPGSRRRSLTRFGPNTLVAPFEIPSEIAEEQLGETGVEGGVEGGTRGSAVGGVVGGVLGGVLDNIAKEMEQPLRVSEIRQPKLVKQVLPIYPEVARQARVEGIVVVEATTDRFGRVIDVKILRSIPLLDQATIDAVRQWIYEPMIINGRPRGVIFTVTANFRLE